MGDAWTVSVGGRVFELAAVEFPADGEATLAFCERLVREGRAREVSSFGA